MSIELKIDELIAALKENSGFLEQVVAHQKIAIEKNAEGGKATGTRTRAKSAEPKTEEKAPETVAAAPKLPTDADGLKTFVSDWM